MRIFSRQPLVLPPLSPPSGPFSPHVHHIRIHRNASLYPPDKPAQVREHKPNNNKPNKDRRGSVPSPHRPAVRSNNR